MYAISTPLIGFGLILIVSSCTVTNNLYVNDPISSGNNSGYIGIGTGIKAKVDSVDPSGIIYFSNKLSSAPNLYFGGQVNLTEGVDLRASMHFPYIIGGLGLRLGIQKAFILPDTNFTIAVGTDIGFVYSKDSVNAISPGVKRYSNGAVNADFFVPFGYRFNQNNRIALTPRYSFNTVNIRTNEYSTETEKFKLNVTSVAIGYWLKNYYFECSAFHYDGKYQPNFGMAYMF